MRGATLARTLKAWLWAPPRRGLPSSCAQQIWPRHQMSITYVVYANMPSQAGLGLIKTLSKNNSTR